MHQTCTYCNYPLILRSQDDPDDPVWGGNHYEYDSDGICFNCEYGNDGIRFNCLDNHP
jgi:hypothetical protein